MEQINRYQSRLQIFKSQIEDTPLNKYINTTKHNGKKGVANLSEELRRPPNEISTDQKRKKPRLQEPEEIEEPANHSADRLQAEVRPVQEVELPLIHHESNMRSRLEIEPQLQIVQKLKPQHKSQISTNRTTGDKTFNVTSLAKSEILIDAEKIKAKGKEISAKKRHLSFIEGQTSKNIAKGFFNIVTLAIPYGFLRLYSYLWGDKVVIKSTAKEMVYYSATEERCKNFCHDLAKINKHLSAQAPRISALENYFLNHAPELIENKNPGIQDSNKIPLPEHLYEGLRNTFAQICQKHHNHPETMELDHFYTIKDGDNEFCIKFMKIGEDYDYSIYVDNYFSHNTAEDIKARCDYVEEQTNILSKDNYSSTLMQALIKFNRELTNDPRRIELDYLYTIMNDGSSEVCVKITKNGSNYDFSIYATNTTDTNRELVEIKKYHSMNLLLAEFAGIKSLNKITSFKVDLDREVLLKTVLSELLSSDKLETADKMLSEILGTAYESSISKEAEGILQIQQQITEDIEKAYIYMRNQTLSFLSTSILLGENPKTSGAELEEYCKRFLEPLEQYISTNLLTIDFKNGVLSNTGAEKLLAIKVSITNYFNNSLEETFHIAPENILARKDEFDKKIEEIVKQYGQIMLLKLNSTNESIKEVLTREKNKLRAKANELLKNQEYSVPLSLIAQPYIFAVIKNNSPKLLGYMIVYLETLSKKAKEGQKLSPLEKTSTLKILSFIRDYYNYKNLLGHPLFPANDFIQEREDRIAEAPELIIAKAKGPSLMKIEDKDLDKIFSSLRPEDLSVLEKLNYKRKEHFSSDDNLSLLPLLLSGVIPIVDPKTREENTMLKQYFQLSSLLTIEEIRDTSPVLTSAERITDFGYFISEILYNLASTAETIKYSTR